MRDRIYMTLVRAIEALGLLAIVVALAGLVVLAAGALNLANAADYCIHPSGAQSSLGSCTASAGPTCSGSSTACTLSVANANLTGGNRALLMGGNYSTKIQPANSGTSNTNRITYQAYGDTNALLQDCSTDAGSTLGDFGAINLDDRSYVTVSGVGATNSTPQMLRVLPTSRCGAGMSMCGSQYSIYESVYMKSCPSQAGPITTGFDCTNTSIGRMGNMCMEAFGLDSSRVTKNNIVRDSAFIGNLDGNKVRETEDNFVIEYDQENNLIENNDIWYATHATLKLTMLPGYGAVVRGNDIRSHGHSGATAYRGGGSRAAPNQHTGDMLWEHNTIRGSFSTYDLSIAAPGNGFQVGSGGNNFRYNVISESGADNDSIPLDVHGISDNWGTKDASVVIACARNYWQNNTVVYGSGAYFKCAENYTPTSALQVGENRMWNNLFYDVYNTSASSGNTRQIEYGNVKKIQLAYGLTSAVNDDRWVNNRFGDPTVTSSQSQIFANGNYGAFSDPTPTTQTFPQAFSDSGGWAGVDYKPDFTSWNGFSNEYNDSAPAGWFTDYNGKDYTLQAGAAPIDDGAPVTQIATADTGSGSPIIVDDGGWFPRECSNYPSWMGVQCDQICIGSSATSIASATCGIQITSRSGNELTVSNAPSRSDGDYVWLYADSAGQTLIDGSAPDIGALEYSSGGDTTPPELAEVTAVPDPTTDTTPSYTFSSSEAGTIAYGGDCSSATVNATSGNNTVIFNTLSVGTHSNCTVTVTDAAANASDPLPVSSFEITSGSNTPPVISFGSPVSTPTVDGTPGAILNVSDADGDTAFTIIAGGSCIVLDGASPTNQVTVGSNAIEFHNPPSGGDLAEGTYTDCTLQVSDGTDASNTLNPTFVVDKTAPVVTFWRPKGEPLDAGTTGVNISITASDAVSMAGGGGCRWSNTDQAYDSMENNFTDQTGDLWDDDLTGLEDGTAYHHYARCRDEAGNRHQASYDITYSVQSSGGAPTISNPSPIANLARAANVATISLDTNITATCRYGLSKETWGTMTEMATTAGTSHSQVIPVNPGNVCKYNVLCSDDAGSTVSSMQSIYIYAPRGKALPTE